MNDLYIIGGLLAYILIGAVINKIITKRYWYYPNRRSYTVQKLTVLLWPIAFVTVAISNLLGFVINLIK